MLSRKSDPISGPIDRRFWVATLGSNSLVVACICVAALVGYLLEYRDNHFRVPWFAQTLTLMMIATGVIMAVSLQLINGISGQFSLGHAGFMAVGAYVAGYASKVYNALDRTDPATRYQNVGQIVWYFVCLAVVFAGAGVAVVGIFSVMRMSRSVARWLPPLVMLGVLGWLTWDFASGFTLDVAPRHLLWTHLIRFYFRAYRWLLNHGMGPAHAFSAALPVFLRRPMCLIVLLAGGGLFAAAAGWLVGLPTLRLRGDYLAIATLGFSMILINIFINSDAVGKSTGLQVPPFPNKADPDRDPVAHYILPWIFGMMVATIAAVWRLAYSPKGRLIRAVREDEIAAAAVGIETTRQKVVAFMVGAFFAGVGGVLYILTQGYANAEQSFGMAQSLMLVIMVTLGGLGSISGAVIAGAVLSALPFIFRQAASSGSLPHFAQAMFSNQYAVLAVLLVVTMLLRPRGLLGGRELWPRRQHRAGFTPVGVAPT